MRTLLSLAAVLLACACGGSSRATPESTPENTSYTSSPTQTEQQIEPVPDLAARDCPIGVDSDEATVAAEPTDTGIALVFVTDADRVADLRARVHAFVASPQGEPAPTAPVGDMTNGRFGPIEVAMSVTDAVDGVRLELRPIDPAQLGELRREVRAKVVAMETGACGPTEIGLRSPVGEQRAELRERGGQP
jgi:hypothetical protein